MRKMFPAAAFISALLLSAVVGTLFSNTAHANPYLWETIPPPAGTEAPTITLLSPENNTVFPVNNVLLNCLVEVGDSTASYQRVGLLVKYKADWLQNETMKNPIQDDDNDGLVKIYLTLTDIPDGNHSIIIDATEIGLIITEARYPTMGLVQQFSMTSSRIVNFTVDTASPIISFLLAENKTYYTLNVSLNFTVNETVSQISYVLDGQENVAIDGNTTLTGLTNGSHNVTVYAWDTAGNIGNSTIIFTVAKPESSPTTLVAVASAASVSIVGLGVLFYVKRSRTKNNRADNV
jgi:hypothetical protein